ncbi:MAG TPA: hypothetical protein PK765_04785 [bacterium]|nr:hypothetical protein [bacterium]
MESWLRPGIRAREFVFRMMLGHRGVISILFLITTIACFSDAVDTYAIRELINTLSDTNRSIADRTSESLWWI